MNEKIECIQSWFLNMEEWVWFDHVGEPLEMKGAKSVENWGLAFEWSDNPLSKWCDFEAKSRIYRLMSEHHYEVFIQWNDVARAMLPSVQQLVKVVEKRFPVQAPQCAVDWLQSLFVGVALETYYDEFIDSRLFRDQIALCSEGRFPCGWYVESEEKFPEAAVVIVY